MDGDAPMAVVQVRLVADTPGDLDRARDVLVAALAERVMFPRPGRPGRRGEWLLYGELHINSCSAHAEDLLLPPRAGAHVDRRGEGESG